MSQKTHRSVDKLLDQFSAAHQHPTNRFTQFFTIPFITFGILGMVWALPFPQLSFLGRYNGFVNWASFLIAFTIYYYYKLSPVLSYGALLFVFACSALIVFLEKLQVSSGWPSPGAICSMIFILGVLFQFVGYSAEGRFPAGKAQLSRFLIAPLWLLSVIFKNIGISSR